MSVDELLDAAVALVRVAASVAAHVPSGQVVTTIGARRRPRATRRFALRDPREGVPVAVGHRAQSTPATKRGAHRVSTSDTLVEIPETA